MTYSRQLSLDPNTAHVKLHLSKRKITCKEPLLPYPDHPQRYDGWQQVLCKDSMTGRCYWEVEWSPGDTWGVFIAVSYKHASRKGLNDCVRFGFNKDSWSLHCSSSGCSFIHCGKVKKVCVVPTTRIGVYVDHKAGDLSFYNINSEKMILLIKEHATFTQPLYPGFWLGTGAKVKLCHDIVWRIIRERTQLTFSIDFFIDELLIETRDDVALLEINMINFLIDFFSFMTMHIISQTNCQDLQSRGCFIMFSLYIM